MQPQHARPPTCPNLWLLAVKVTVPGTICPFRPDTSGVTFWCATNRWQAPRMQALISSERVQCCALCTVHGPHASHTRRPPTCPNLGLLAVKVTVYVPGHPSTLPAQAALPPATGWGIGGG